LVGLLLTKFQQQQEPMALICLDPSSDFN